MPWWSWVWVAVMSAMTIAGAGVDLKDREPLWYTALGVGSGTACIIFVLNFFGLIRLGNLKVLAVATLVALVYEAWRDVRGQQELTAAEKSVSVGVTVGLFAPAILLGLLGP